jgi:prophage regulatory protein
MSPIPQHQSGFVREKHILQLIPVAHSTLWEWVNTGKFPAPLKLSKRVTVWKRADVEEFIAKQGGAP